MKNILKKTVLILIVVLSLFSSFALAATKQDVINAINASYYVSEEQPSFRLPEKYRNKGITYLNEHELTSKQYSQILAAINEGVAYAREIGHTHYKKYTKEQLNRALSIVNKACAAAEVDMNEEVNKESAKKAESTKTNSNSSTTNNKTNNTNKTNNSNKQNSNKDTSKQNTNNDAKQTNTTNNIEENKVDNQIMDSGDIILSGDVMSSGETLENSDLLSGEDFNLIDIISDDKPVNINSEINRNIALVIAGIVILVVLNILIIRLIFKKIRFKILRYVLIVIFILIVVALLVALGFLLYYLDEIKLAYQIYYLLK